MSGAALGRFLSFDAVAGEYDQTRVIPAPIIETLALLCAETAHLKQGGMFLDAGVGTGRFAAPLSRLAPGQIVGVDISLPMMRHAREKALFPPLPLVQADLQRLPFSAGLFQGALAVHILHLIEDWKQVLREIRRVLVPRTGVLLLGTELGGRSVLVDRYYAQARKKGLLKPSLGAPGHSALLRFLQSQGAWIEARVGPALVWTRQATVQQTLEILAPRPYSQMWSMPEAAHRSLLIDTAQFAADALGGSDAVETLEARFVLSAVRWP